MKCPKCGQEIPENNHEIDDISSKPMTVGQFKVLVMIQAALTGLVIAAVAATPFTSISIGIVGRIICLIAFVGICGAVDYGLYRKDLNEVNPFSKFP